MKPTTVIFFGLCKAGFLGVMQTSKFTYINNSLNLLHGLLALAVSIFFIFIMKIPSSFTMSFSLLVSVFCFFIFCFMLWASTYHINNFRKLYGVKRDILVKEKSIIFPELPDSLKIIELRFSQIIEIYYGKNRHGRAHNLIIKYDKEGYACIGEDELDDYDFEEICRLFMLNLGLEKIETKNA